jgi:nucleoside-diphosphate-sugar epimerase
MGLALPSDDLDEVLAQTPGFWSRFGGARLFITGGTGFIGSWLIQAIQRANDKLGARIEIVALSRTPERARLAHPLVFARQDIQLLQGDVTDFHGETGPLDLCIHAASDVGDPRQSSAPLQTFDSIVAGTRCILDVARSRGATRFLLTSSGAVYGTQPENLTHVPESYQGAPDPMLPSSAYGNGKRAAEWLACAYAAQHGANGFETMTARIFALLGPGLPLNSSFAAGNFIRDALSNKAIIIQGDGRPLRSYLYMSDLCVWLLRILESGQSGQAYNVGSEHPVSILDLAGQISRAAGYAASIEVKTAVDPRVPPPRYVPDTHKARLSLNLREQVPLPLALQKTLHWSRSAMTP